MYDLLLFEIVEGQQGLLHNDSDIGLGKFLLIDHHVHQGAFRLVL